MNHSYDVVIIGAGAAGLMCAITAGNRGRSVLVLDHANKVGKKILMSGGGKCNFTNYHIEPENFISNNPHFCKSALSRYSQWDFIALVEKHEISYHEKTLGQLFCDNKSSDILNMLLTESKNAGVRIEIKTPIKTIEATQNNKFIVGLESETLSTDSVVIASGGLSIPTMGATNFAWKIGQQFDLKVFPDIAGLVPFIFNQRQQKRFSDLAGTAVEVVVSCNHQSFREAMLFTHKGLSGPAILQISSYWKLGEPIEINLLPNNDVTNWFLEKKLQRPKSALKTILSEIFTKKFSEKLCEFVLEEDGEIAINQLTEKNIEKISKQLSCWKIYPDGTEGYRTAEVTMGGIDTDEISSKTFETKKQSGLYFIGEALDVTGHLGGYNFQWAWSSGYAAGHYV